MSNFRILILAFLVVVLAVLGMIYVNISSRMDVIQQQQQMAPLRYLSIPPRIFRCPRRLLPPPFSRWWWRILW